MHPPGERGVGGDAAPGRNLVQGRIAFAAYLGNALRYDVDLGQGVLFKADIRDPWHHEQRPMGSSGDAQLPRHQHRGDAGAKDEAAARSPGASLGFGLIWAFLIVFVLYPLTRIFYDAVHQRGRRSSRWSTSSDFFTDSFYLRSFWKSMVLGWRR